MSLKAIRQPFGTRKDALFFKTRCQRGSRNTEVQDLANSTVVFGAQAREELLGWVQGVSFGVFVALRAPSALFEGALF